MILQILRHSSGCRICI